MTTPITYSFGPGTWTAVRRETFCGVPDGMVVMTFKPDSGPEVEVKQSLVSRYPPGREEHSSGAHLRVARLAGYLQASGVKAPTAGWTSEPLNLDRLVGLRCILERDEHWIAKTGSVVHAVVYTHRAKPIPEGSPRARFLGDLRVPDWATELEAVAFAIERHGNRMYGGLSYVTGHLVPVVDLLIRSGLGPLEAAGWLHDVVEDTNTTLDEVREQFGDGVADLVGAVTSEPGANREERNAATYPKIRAAGRNAVALKLADRICNVSACWANSDKRLFMYAKEYPDFREALRVVDQHGWEVGGLWNRLDRLLAWET